MDNGKKSLDFAIAFEVTCSWQLMELVVSVCVTSGWGHPFFYLNVFIYLLLLASILAAAHFSGLFSLGIIVPSSLTTGRGQVGNRIYLVGQHCAASLFKVAGYGENRLFFVWLETLLK